VIRYTQQDDWLYESLSANASILISGHPSLSQSLGLSVDQIVSILFVGNKREIIGYVVTIKARDGTKQTIQDVKEALSGNAVIGRLGQILGSPPLIVICSEEEHDFVVSDDVIAFREVDDAGMRETLSKMDKRLTQNVGVMKEINKSINDKFQLWRRGNTSKYYVFHDFDAISVNPSVIFELKRVQENLETWKPFVDDSSNYATLNLIGRSRGIPIRVIAYNIDVKERIAYHQIAYASKAGIDGSVCVCDPDFVIDPENDLSILKMSTYSSTRRRQ
jgi:hypothetical protein